MKEKWTVYEWVFLLLAILFTYVLGVIITAMVLSHVPTTEENKEIREQIIEMVAGVLSTINIILGFKLRGMVDKKDNNDKFP